MSVELNNGVQMPLIGIGTKNVEDDEGVRVISCALRKHGYRYIDTAWAYGNETEIRQGVNVSGVPRSELFISGLLWSTRHRKVEEGLDETLANLGTDYLDLFMLHWPVALNPNGNHPIYPLRLDGQRDVDSSVNLADTWKQMEDVLRKGKVRAIGVSNCSRKYIDKILETAEIVPAVNQLELHPYNPQHELVEYLLSKDIRPIASCPLGSSRGPAILRDPVVMGIAKRRSLLPSEVLLGWLNAKGIPAIPKSASCPRLASNLKAPTFATQLKAKDMLRLDKLSAGGKQCRFFTPQWPVDLGFDDWVSCSSQSTTPCQTPTYKDSLRGFVMPEPCNPVKISRCGCQYL